MVHTILSVIVVITLSAMVVASFCKEISKHTSRDTKRLEMTERAFTWVSLLGWALWIIVSFYIVIFM